MDTRELGYFLAVVDHDGFGRAAEHLHLAQPSLSQAIKALERRLGTPLFHRTSKGVVLTEAGRALIGPARQVIRDLQTAGETIDAVKGLRHGRVDIASMPSPAIDPLSGMISRFSAHAPEVTVNVMATPTVERTLEAVRSGSCEIGVLGTPHALHEADLATRRLGSQRFVVISSADDDTPGDLIDRGELAGRKTIVGPRGTGMRLLIEEMRDSGIDLSVVVETEHREAILTLVADGVGSAVLTDGWAPVARRMGLRVFDLDPPAYLHLWMITRKAPATPAARHFWDMHDDGGDERG
ncbi:MULTISPECIES: LysR family transcriptional regulator [Actinopolyspora]|uniref:LysR family transcriptional regulator n=1 Tax=Actinopolyspora TaxID=1849 RepID=UPI00037132CB|nr:MULTISPECIES: LysR family transcriptional regulator [Actinopolyspora]NHD16165.1 LysR family transcriptional regulator [Actinopolyspora sp. BKK2]NHE74621.1 LysR family transcriptional regulator [Actinopolyspora sp. BKK1]